MTEAQARLLMRYSKDITLLYDSDSAGVEAALRAIDILKTLNAEVKAVWLEGAKDPDEYILKFGKEDLEEKLKNPLTAFEFKEKYYLSKYDLEKVDEKTKFINEIVKELVKVKNAIEQEIYIKKIAQNNNISEHALATEIKRRNKDLNENVVNISSEDFEKNKEKYEKSKEIVNINKSRINNEEILLRVILDIPGNIDKIRNEILVSYLEIEENKRVLEYLYSLTKEKIENIYTIISNDSEKTPKDIATRILEISAKEINVDEVILEKLIVYFKIEELEKEKKLILSSFNDPELDIETKKMLMLRLKEIAEKIAKFKY